MENKLFCFDVDGTLRDNVNHDVSDSTRKALFLLKQKGYKLAISSGRGIDSLKATGLMEFIDWDGFVCNNGQVVLNRCQEEIFHASMNKDSVLKTIQKANELGYAVMLKSHPRFITKEPDEYVYEAQRFFNNHIPHLGEYHGQDVDAMVIYGPKKYDYAPFLDIDGIQVLPGESTYADIIIGDVSKATGIKQLLELYHLDGYIAFGDSLNDMEMFRYADISIAMGQGNQKLKNMATYVTSSIDEDGIYQACLHYHFIEK